MCAGGKTVAAIRQSQQPPGSDAALVTITQQRAISPLSSSIKSLSHQSLNGTISPLCPCQGSPALGSSSHRTQKIIWNNVTQILHNDQWAAEKVHCLLCEVSGISFTTSSLLCRVTLANKQVYGQSRDQSGLVKSSRIFSPAISSMIAGSTAQHLGIRQSNYLGTSWN